jgi:hypothetical protein
VGFRTALVPVGNAVVVERLVVGFEARHREGVDADAFELSHAVFPAVSATAQVDDDYRIYKILKGVH